MFPFQDYTVIDVNHSGGSITNIVTLSRKSLVVFEDVDSQTNENNAQVGILASISTTSGTRNSNIFKYAVIPSITIGGLSTIIYNNEGNSVFKSGTVIQANGGGSSSFDKVVGKLHIFELPDAV